MVPTTNLDIVRRMREEAWRTPGMDPAVQSYARSEFGGDAGYALAEFAYAGRAASAKKERPVRTSWARRLGEKIARWFAGGEASA
jgi:hypothetical protein